MSGADFQRVGRNHNTNQDDDNHDVAPVTGQPDNNNNNNTNIINNTSNNNDEDVIAAQATAEIAATAGYQNVADRHGDETRVAEQALMGVDGDGIAAVEVTDESGELVQQRFVEFLNTL
jgi:hypothetical protein